MKEQIKKRQEYNRKLVNLLSELVEKYPQLRFGQILYVFDFITRNGELFDPFNEESYETYQRIMKKGLQ